MNRPTNSKSPESYYHAERWFFYKELKNCLLTNIEGEEVPISNMFFLPLHMAYKYNLVWFSKKPI